MEYYRHLAISMVMGIGLTFLIMFTTDNITSRMNEFQTIQTMFIISTWSFVLNSYRKKDKE
jgi:predicted membrane protein